MKLELKNIAPYLPYGLKVKSYHEDNEYHTMTLSIEGGLSNLSIVTLLREQGDFYCYKPILRPLSDLNNEIEINGEKFTPIDELSKITTLEYSDGVLWQSDWDAQLQETETQYLCYAQIEKLIEWHFDISELIQAGLAIDINTLEK